MTKQMAIIDISCKIIDSGWDSLSEEEERWYLSSREYMEACRIVSATSPEAARNGLIDSLNWFSKYCADEDKHANAAVDLSIRLSGNSVQ